MADGLVDFGEILVGGHGEQAEEKAIDHAEILQKIADDLVEPRLTVDEGLDQGTKRNDAHPANRNENERDDPDGQCGGDVVNPIKHDLLQ